MHKLAKQGTQVVVPYRDADEQRHLKVMGDLGQIVALVRAPLFHARDLLLTSVLAGVGHTQRFTD